MKPTRQRLSSVLQRRPASRLSVALALVLLTALAGDLGAAGRSRALLSAAEAGDAARVRDLLKSGANVNARDERGRTALMSAALAGHLTVAQTLIDARADLNATDRNGLSALIAAVRRDDVDIARALLAAGAAPNLSHRAYGTALEIAERSDAQALVALLRAHGARGAGKSVGDVVCVRLWKGQGYCGTVTAVDKVRWTLRVTRLVGCAKGCAPDPCSMGRTVGGGRTGSIAVGDEMQVEGACLTHTGLFAEEQ
jgi:hypothetical protein